VENDGSFWNQAAFAVSTQNRAVSLDLLGFGQSPKPADIPYTVENHLESIELTLESLLRDSEERMTIVGHSIGGIIAAAFAAKHPERVSRLVLFSVPINERDVAAGAGRLHQARAAFVDNFGPLREKGIKLSKSAAVRSVLGRDRLTRYLPTLRSLANTVEVEQVGRDLKAVPEIPVTVVYGTRDPFVVPEYVESLGELRDNIEVARLDAGHDIATQFAAVAARFVDPELPADLVEDLTAKAAKDPKLRPGQSSWKRLFAEDTPLVLFRAVLYLALGLSMLFLPPQGDLTVLRLAFAVFIFARSISFITSVFTTHSIQQEKITNAASGLVGIAIGLYLMLGPNVSQTILMWVAAGYLLFNGVVNLFAAIHTSPQSGRRGRLLWQGVGEVLMSLLLFSGSILAARLVSLFIMGTSIAAGVALITYLIVTTKLGRAFAEKPR